MEKEKFSKDDMAQMRKMFRHHHDGFMGGGYGIVLIGAAVYFVQQSEGFWMGVLGVLKAIVWPAMLIYKVFTMINM